MQKLAVHEQQQYYDLPNNYTDKIIPITKIINDTDKIIPITKIINVCSIRGHSTTTWTNFG